MAVIPIAYSSFFDRNIVYYFLFVASEFFFLIRIILSFLHKTVIVEDRSLWGSRTAVAYYLYFTGRILN